ncbi:hypothetical protein GPAL_1301 [Glaciecola pallidula DSM 14239 = ACAM 615]|uniref:Uncharacterized protein n=1 Tax=Brumicola pallidula DSM 14239 = ACAM 615 TaxID=1121922 RepID=K6Y5V8_9ALTE|nr:hypothetical protein GPAL_1301 [Glaciecola pallidula DSM 14239 = ACAM 615]
MALICPVIFDEKLVTINQLQNAYYNGTLFIHKQLFGRSRFIVAAVNGKLG